MNTMLNVIRFIYFGTMLFILYLILTSSSNTIFTIVAGLIIFNLIFSDIKIARQSNALESDLRRMRIDQERIEQEAQMIRRQFPNPSNRRRFVGIDPARHNDEGLTIVTTVKKNKSMPVENPILSKRSRLEDID